MHHAAHAAIGAAIRAAAAAEHRSFSLADLAGMSSESPAIPRSRRLSMDKVVNLLERLHPFVLPENGERVPVTLGIDIGSVSTNVVLLDREGRVVREIYTGTQARPVEVVTADGQPLTYGRALGRSAGEILSGLICYIGYIIAGFDSEKRALHDHMAGTRVIYK